MRNGHSNRQLQYDTHEKELEEQSWECSNTKAKKNIYKFLKNIINFANVYPLHKITRTIRFLRN